MEQPTLVILAAGVGRRYGGLKQLEPVGPGGEAILDYTIFDALRAGFGRAVLVVREETDEIFRDSLVSRIGGAAEIELVHQDPDRLPGEHRRPAGRTKPWGTAHAVLAASGAVDGPMAVANADDFYGAESFSALARFFADGGSSQGSPWAMVGFELGPTLSDEGAVSRGLCRRAADGWLEAIEEIPKVSRHPEGARYTGADGVERVIPASTVVSMNLWAFSPEVFTELERGFGAFLETSGHSTDAECYLPEVVQQAIAAGRARVRVLEGGGTWCGVTYRDDKSTVRHTIERLIEEGRYPRRLWSR